jgi:hypothetical protein
LVDTLGVEPPPFLHTSFYVDGPFWQRCGIASALGPLVLALRHQLNVLRLSVKRPKLTTADRFLWARLSRFWTGWRSALVIVKPKTVIAWHGKGFRVFWTWKVRRGQPGRPSVCQEARKLIRQMSRDNPLRGFSARPPHCRRLGSAEHPRRTAQAGHRHRRDQCWQVKVDQRLVIREPQSP